MQRCLSRLPYPAAQYLEAHCASRIPVQVGGGKPKMRWYFKRNGWPTSSVLDGRVPATEQEQALLIDTLQVGHHRGV